MQLSKNLKIFFGYFAQFLEYKSNFKHFGTKDERTVNDIMRQISK